MKFKKTDIGGEIVSILTRGMYSDPRDALREYVQNGVDAGAKNISIKIRQDNIVVEDDGKGMDFETIRKAVRLGISDKNPKKNVGFMGIGIYSSFHLCDKLIIISKSKNQSPCKLVLNFKEMRDKLDKQKEAKFQKKFDERNIVGLQPLLEKNIKIEVINEKEYTKIGTRVEMINIESNFFKTLSKFDEVSDYLEQVVPLPFNPKFRWGKLIESKINEICKRYKADFELVNLTLQVNEAEEKLYRPYTDYDFDPEPLKPYFHELKNDETFFGVAWGCLNSSRNQIANRNLRGFLIKRQGFAIGTRDNLIKYFGRQIFFNRYIGEIIVVHSTLLPNAPRTDFEFSGLRVSFYDCLRDMATYFNDKANEYQEFSKSDEELDYAINTIKEYKSQLNYFAKNNDRLLDFLIFLRDNKDSLERRLERGCVRKERESDAKSIIRMLSNLIKDTRELIDTKSVTTKKLKTEVQLAEEISKIPKKSKYPEREIEFRNLIEVAESLGIDTSNYTLKRFLVFFDENFVQKLSENGEDYLLKLKKIKNDVENLLDEE
jgi:hypothetical protein